MDQQIAIRPLLSSQALPAFWQSTSATGLVCRKEDRSDRDGPDDRAEGAGEGAGRRGHPQRLLEYRLALVRSLTRSAWKANLTFEAGAEELNGIADQSVDLAICIDAFEHMLDKRAVLASMYRKIGARFFCLTPGADYVWYRTIAPVLGFGTKHLFSDRILTHQESVLLEQAGFAAVALFPRHSFPKVTCPPLCATAHHA